MSWVILEQGDKRTRIAVAAGADGVWVGWPGGSALLSHDREGPRDTVDSDDIRAPMTGRVIEVKAAVGAEVRRDDLLVILEAMKMEYRLCAPRDGRISDVRCAAGQLVDLGQTLVALAPAAATP